MRCLSKSMAGWSTCGAPSTKLAISDAAVLSAIRTDLDRSPCAERPVPDWQRARPRPMWLGPTQRIPRRSGGSKRLRRFAVIWTRRAGNPLNRRRVTDAARHSALAKPPLGALYSCVGGGCHRSACRFVQFDRSGRNATPAGDLKKHNPQWQGKGTSCVVRARCLAGDHDNCQSAHFQRGRRARGDRR
jgi:hypothetical protein